jgi:hypothetical protein
MFSHTWLLSHPSDHSAVNFRNNVILKISESSRENDESKMQFNEDMLRESSNFIVERPGSEALWYHRRFLCDLFFMNLHSSKSEVGLTRMKFSQLIRKIGLDINADSWLGGLINECSDIESSAEDSLLSRCYSFLETEIAFVILVTQEQARWNASKQETCSKQYAAHVIRKIITIMRNWQH